MHAQTAFGLRVHKFFRNVEAIVTHTAVGLFTDFSATSDGASLKCLRREPIEVVSLLMSSV